LRFPEYGYTLILEVVMMRHLSGTLGPGCVCGTRPTRHPSVGIDFDDRLGELPWRFLRKVVSDSTLDDPVGIFARKLAGID